MRIWDVPVNYLCMAHLCGEHAELHSIWTILTELRTESSYWNHPEVQRWRNARLALYRRHEEQVAELLRRGKQRKKPSQHTSVLNLSLANGLRHVPYQLMTNEQQINWLLTKRCKCQIAQMRASLV